LYDGVGGRDAAGSTAEMAKLLAAPVVLGVEGETTPRSIAATVLGFQRFDPDTPLAGVLVTGLLGQHQPGGLAEAVGQATGLPVLGGLPRRADLQLAERGQGMVPGADQPDLDAWVERLADAAAAWVDLERLVDLARRAPPLRLPPPGVYPAQPVGRARI